MSLANKARQAQALEQARNNAQTESANGRSVQLPAVWRGEYGSESPAGAVVLTDSRKQSVVDNQRGSWQTELGDPFPVPYGDVQFKAARDLIAALGGDAVVQGFWDYRYGISAPNGRVDSWSDIRGGSVAGPLAASGNQRPTLANDGTINFDAVANFLRCSSGLQGITGSCWVVLVGLGTGATAKRDFELSVAGTTTILFASFAAALTWVTSGLATAATSAALTASPRIFHARRTVTVDVAAEVGSAAEVAAASGQAALTASRLTIGGDRTDAGGSFSNMQGLRAVIAGAGVYTAALRDLINAWAVSAHGAVLTV